MKSTSIRLLSLIALCVAGSCAMAQARVGVSIGINQPGVYGQIDIGNYPPPLVINPQPVVIVPSPVVEPLYLYVPVEYQVHWARYCGEYNACGRRVYFVREDWVRERYEERRHFEHERGHGRGHGRYKNDDD